VNDGAAVERIGEGDRLIKLSKQATYPDLAFSSDKAAQRQLDTQMTGAARFERSMFGATASTFAATLLLSHMGCPILTLIGAVATLILAVPPVVSLACAPTLDCPRCHMKMRIERVYSPLAAEFLVCRSCQIALETHRTLAN
jgi:hypothetical protein